jgi:hypothetical protein
MLPVVLLRAQVPVDLTGGQFATNCGNATVAQVFDDAKLAGNQYGVNNMTIVSDPDIVLIGNQWWMVWANGPGPTRAIEPYMAYLPAGASLSTTTVYPADPNGWHIVGANSTNTGKGVPVAPTPSPAGFDVVAAETPSADVGPDGTVSVYYSAHNEPPTTFQIGLMSNVVNGAGTGDPVPAMVPQQPWEFADGLGAILEQSVRWMPQLNKFIMYYTAAAWWDNPPTNHIAYAESTDGITWTNRTQLDFPVSYYNQDFLYNPLRNRYEMVISNDPTGKGGGNGRNLVWREAATPAVTMANWINETTLLQYNVSGGPTWFNQGLLSPAVKYGNLPGEQNRIYVFFHSYSPSGDMSIGRFYCDATNATTAAFNLTTPSPALVMAPGNGTTVPVTVNPINGFTGTVNFAISGVPTGASATMLPASSTTGSTFVIYVGTSTAAGRYPITVTGTSGSLIEATTFTLTVTGQNQTITLAPLTPNPITYGQVSQYTLSASSSSGLPVTLTAVGPGTISGNVLTVTGGGTIVVGANQAGNGTYNAAPQVTTNLVINPLSQTVTFNSVPPQASGTSLNLAPYVSASSGLTVNQFTSLTTSVCTTSGSIATFLIPGSCTIVALQTGNATYTIAGAGQTITVNQGVAQTITFATIPTQTAGGTVTLSATASSGLAVSFASTTPTVCTVSGSTATLVTGGTCSITASQAGNTTYSAAPSVTKSFTVLFTQTITFPTVPAQHVGTPLVVNATASSGLPVSYTVVQNGNCSVSGSTVTFLHAGACGVIAAQSGNSTYAAAAAVGQVIIAN